MLTYETISEKIKSITRQELLAGKIVIVRGATSIPIRGVKRITYPNSVTVIVDSMNGEQIQIQEGDDIISI